MFQTLIDPAFLAGENGGTPVLDLNFAALKSLDSRITFTRASSGTYLDSSGILQTAASSAARFTHDPVTGRSLGLLIESGRTNLLTYSEAINNAAWTHVGGSHTANQTTAPSGELTADLFTENSAASTQHRLYQTPTVASGTTYTVSVFVKRASGSRQFGIILNTGTAVSRVYFNLDTGTVGTVVAGSGTITAYPNGWYRCTATGVSDGLTGTTFFQLCNGTTSGSETYTGDGTSGLYIWGTQLEAGAFATSYIQTTSASASRSADVATMTSTNFSAWYNQTEGTIAANAATADASTATIVTIDDNTLNNRIYIQRETSSSIARGVVAVSGSNVASIAVTGVSTSLVAALSYKANQFNFAAAGTAGTPDTSGTIPTVDRMRIGTTSVAGYEINGTIARFRYFNRALPASVQSISA
jgi:hypothetical protein